MKKTKETNRNRKEPRGAKKSKQFSMGMFIVLLILGGIPGLIYGSIYLFDFLASLASRKKVMIGDEKVYVTKPSSGNAFRLVWAVLVMLTSLIVFITYPDGILTDFSLLTFLYYGGATTILTAVFIVLSVLAAKKPEISLPCSIAMLVLALLSIVTTYMALVYYLVADVLFLFVGIVGIFRGFKYPKAQREYLAYLAELEAENTALNAETQPESPVAAEEPAEASESPEAAETDEANEEPSESPEATEIPEESSESPSED